MRKLFAVFSNITNKQAIIIILMIACFHAINSLIILSHNQFYSYLNEDVTSIIDMSTSFVHEYNISNQILNKISFAEIVHTIVSYWKPPAYFIFSLPFIILIHNINLFIVILNLFISITTLLSVYGICKKLMSIQTGLLASFMLSFYPLFFVMHRTFFIETFLMATISLVIYLILFDKFNSFYFNICFLFVVAIGMLTKEQFFMYIPIFLLFFVKKENYKELTKNIFFFIDFILAIILSYIVWYFDNAKNIFLHLYKYSTEVINSDLLFYLKSLYYFDITPIIVILSIISVLYFVFRKKYYTIILSIVFIVLLFSLSGNKVSRHIFPVIMFFSILSSLFIFEIKNIYIRRIFIFLICILMIIQFVLINYSSFQNFKSGNFYGYNSFRGITYYDYQSNLETYKSQYIEFNQLLGEKFELNTVFVQIFPPIAYNFLILQKDRNGNLCQVKTYDDIKKIKIDIGSYENIIISSRDKNVFETFNDWLLQNTNFKQIRTLNMYNHDNAKIYLYQSK